MDSRRIELDAAAAKLPELTEFVDAFLEEAACPMRAQMQIDVAVEEIFMNIASYAYAPATGTAQVILTLCEEPRGVEITFIDGGVPYDPLAKEDPDVTLSAQERQIGGLGIFMTKKTMDEVRYERAGDRNVLTLIKRI